MGSTCKDSKTVGRPPPPHTVHRDCSHFGLRRRIWPLRAVPRSMRTPGPCPHETVVKHRHGRRGGGQVAEGGGGVLECNSPPHRWASPVQSGRTICRVWLRLYGHCKTTLAVVNPFDSFGVLFLPSDSSTLK